ncbi:MAG: CvpA family protein [Desulfohalobiaceae bacterium]|nr:CvpA family protein [Desulfohalobiaceae bacterium]
MNSLDIIFISILAYTLIRGLMRGLVKEFASVFGLVFGFIIANNYFEQLSLIFQRLISNPRYAAIVSYVVLFVAALLAVIFIAHILRKFLDIVMLSWVDRIGGGMLGLGKGGLLCSLILFMTTLFVAPQTSFLTDSLTSPYISLFARNLTGLVPRELKENFEEKSAELQKKWEGSLLEDLQNPG